MVSNKSTSRADRVFLIKDYALAKRKLRDEENSFQAQQKLELENYERELRNSTQRDSRALGSPRDRDNAYKEQLKAFKDEQKRKFETLKTSLDVGKVQAKQKLLDAQYGASTQDKQYVTLSNRNRAKIAILEGMDKAEAYEMYGFNVEAQRARDQTARKIANKEQILAAAELRREQKPELKAAEEKDKRLAATAGMTEEQKAQRMTDINNEKIKSGLMGQSGVALSRLAQRDEQNFMDSQPMLTNYADRAKAFGAYQRKGLTFDESYGKAFGDSYSPKSGSGVLYANEGGSVTKPLDFRKGGFVPVKDKKK